MTLNFAFECPICAEIYSDDFVPTTLPCGHSCCLSHVDGLNKVCYYCKQSFNPKRQKPSYALLDASLWYLSKSISLESEKDKKSIIEDKLIPTAPILPNEDKEKVEGTKYINHEDKSSSNLTPYSTNSNVQSRSTTKAKTSINKLGWKERNCSIRNNQFVDVRYNRYSDQLMQLAEMGFTDFDQCIKILEESYDQDAQNIEEIVVMLISLTSEESLQNQNSPASLALPSISLTTNELSNNIPHRNTQLWSNQQVTKICGRCGHTHCQLLANECCACLDKRPHQTSYERYVDGAGIQQNAPRNFYYCPGCRNIER